MELLFTLSSHGAQIPYPRLSPPGESQITAPILYTREETTEFKKDLFRFYTSPFIRQSCRFPQGQPYGLHRTEPSQTLAPRNRLPDAAYAGNGQSSFFTCASSHLPPSCARNPAELFGPWQPRLPRLLEHEYTSMTRKGHAVALSAMPVVVGVGVFVFFYGVYSEDVGL